ncbi:23S rRNA (guanosine(2251)-2'-O)-methyltransferase RlmB [Anthocerotibacter panamensis]|uniref:23S rRNA (guanosine(2251)-2'-O)-methyltransferase RlmB n=1 Tax=Anthocerotibacter panamensis TaxID=2857077 RepID=UPI001C406789|nr:23S rRNA (guanosine(2251)-2'-O)-methyltransferase RlmB [Anthocerotibacter panamensis]
MKAKPRSNASRSQGTGSPRLVVRKKTQAGTTQSSAPERSRPSRHGFKGAGRPRPDKEERFSGAGRAERDARPARSTRPTRGKEERFSGEGRVERDARPARAARPTRGKEERPTTRPTRPTSDRFTKARPAVAVRTKDVPYGVKRTPRFKPEPQTKNVPEEHYAIALDEEQTPEESPELIYGRQGVLAALKSERQLNRIWIVEQLRYDNRFLALLDQAKAKGTVIDVVDRERLDHTCEGANHQGVAAQVAAYHYWELEDLVTHALTSYRPVIVVAEGLEDPQNLGSLIRSCEAMGVQGLILPQRRAVGVTATVAKVSAGAIEHLPISRVVNLRQALERLKEAGFWIVGTDANADKEIYEIDLAGPTVVVIGSEHKGLSLLIQKSCDLIASIPIAGKTPSLNAAVAGAVVIYELQRQRQSQRLDLT